MLVAGIFILTAEKQYESSAALLINDEEKGVDDAEMIESINFFKTKKIVENEIEVISSREVITKVVNQLDLYAPIYKKSGFKTVTAYESAPVRIKLSKPRDKSHYIFDDEHSFTFDSSKKQVTIDGQNYEIDKWLNSPYGKGEIMFYSNPKNESRLDNDTYYFRFTSPRFVTEQIFEGLSAKASSKLSTVIRLEYKTPNAVLGEDILGELINAYKMSAVEDRDAVARNTLEFIETRMNEVGSELESVEKELENYRAQEGVIDLSKQGNMYLQNVGDYDRQLNEINIKLSILNNVRRYVNSKNKSGMMVPSTVGVDDPILSQLLADLYDAEIEYARLKETTAVNNPILVAVSNRIAKLRPSIIEIVNNQRANLQGSRSNISSTSGKYNKALQVLPEQERKLIEITRRKKNVSDQFDYLVQKREETALAYAPTSNDVKIIESPQTTLNPVSPKKSLILFMAMLLSLGFSMAVIVARELISSKILYRSELENYIDLPVIGELSHIEKESDGSQIITNDKVSIPQRIKNALKSFNSKFTKPISRKEGMLTRDNEDIFIVDQFRQILAYLGFYSRRRSVKKLLITSSIQGEGKSYVSSSLAQTLAFSGKKVALVDMDLRNREISTLYNYENVLGISNYLSGDLNYKHIARVVGEDQLHVLPAGTKAINSSELLTSERLDKLVKNLEADYDFILFDTPPINLVSDAQTLNHFCDKTVLIVRHGFTPKFVIEHLDENIFAKGFKNCSVVFNGVKNRGMVNKYSYGYGYGYSEAQTTTSEWPLDI
jgi:capsular exopolysaccharide synthesis family protein